MTEQKRFGSGRGRGRELPTRLVQIGVRFDTATGAVSVPIYQTATFAHPQLGVTTGYDYIGIEHIADLRADLEQALKS